MNTDPHLQSIIIKGLESYLLGTNFPQTTEYPLHYYQLIRDQNQIGWINFLRGRWSLRWTTSQAKYYRANPCPAPPDRRTRPNNPNRWACKVLKTIWTEWYSMWENQNKDRHGFNAKTRDIAQREQLSREITQLYATKLHQPQRLQHIFHTPLSTLLTQPTYALQHWLTLWKPALL
jgi:hypothetical protein